jgi:hypothetical protein
MYRALAVFAVVAGLILLLVGIDWAAVPAPPVNQAVGMLDVLYGQQTEADCRSCHAAGVSDRHHLFYDTPIPDGSLVPYPDGDNNGVADTTYGCLNCHDADFDPLPIVRDCTVCHTASPHHQTPAAAGGDCVFCHGDLVDNIDDGHYIPTSPPTDTTPLSSDGDGLPLNSRGHGAGACNYCHDDDGLETPIIRDSALLHHGVSWDGAVDCRLCHDDWFDPLSIRSCEGCHGPDSLHSIQADSPAAGNLGTIVVGGELAGYGHVGRNAGPGDSDCWGCHGFAYASAPPPSPLTPTIYSIDPAVVRAGRDAMVIVYGAGFISSEGGTLSEADIRLTAADGSSVILEPDLILDHGTMVVTIPGRTRPGNYNLRAVKAGNVSNPAVLSVVPWVRISRAVYQGRVSILGTGFGGYVEGSSTTVTGTITSGSGRRATTKTVTATIVSWSNSKIVADFGTLPRDVTVNSVFGSAKSAVSR